MILVNTRNVADNSRVVDQIDPSRELLTGEAVLLDLRPASFPIRALGALIDILVSVGLLILMIYIIGFFGEMGLLDPALSQALGIVALVFAIVIVPVGVETLTRGRSLGKLATGVRIVRDDGGAIQFRHALIRQLTGVLEVWMTMGGLASLIALLDPRTKRLGDMMAGTFSQVIRVPQPFNSPQALYPPELAAWRQVADVAKLPTNLARRISGFIAQAPDLNPHPRARLAAELVAEASPWISPMPHAHPESVLRAITVIRRERDQQRLALAEEGLEKLTPVLRANPNQFPVRQ